MKKIFLSIIILLIFSCVAREIEQRFIIILLDETASFSLNSGNEKVMFWDEAIKKSMTLVSHLQAGDKIAVIGIDDHGFDVDDIRIEENTINYVFIKSKQDKKKLKEMISNLKPRQHKRPYTDILGALYHTAYLLKKQSEYKGYIFVFSDMLQTPSFPSKDETTELSFPPKTKCFFFYVATSGKENWERIVQIWLNLLRESGLEIGENSFFQRGEDIDEILKEILE